METILGTALGALIGIGAVAVDRWLAARAEERAAKRRAYAGLLAYSPVVLLWSSQMRHAPPDKRSDVHRELIPTLQQMSEATADVWTIGSRQAVAASTEILDLATKVTQAVDPSSDKEWRQLAIDLGNARLRFIQLVRGELKLELVSEDEVGVDPPDWGEDPNEPT